MFFTGIFQYLHKETTGERISRQDFLLKLAENLATDFIEEYQLSKENIPEKVTNICGRLYKQKPVRSNIVKRTKQDKYVPNVKNTYAVNVRSRGL